jgi:hypothetical protein
MAESASQNTEALVESYARELPEDLEILMPEQRNEIYRMLRLRVRLDKRGPVGMEGLLSVSSDADHTSR